MKRKNQKKGKVEEKEEGKHKVLNNKGYEKTNIIGTEEKIKKK